MPRRIVSKETNRAFLVFDPSIAGELTVEQMKLYTAQKDAHAKAAKLSDEFIAKFKADAAAAGNTSDLQVFLRYGKVSIALDDGRKGAAKSVTPSKDVDWTKVGAALSTTA